MADLSIEALYARVMEIDRRVRLCMHDVDAAVKDLDELVLHEMAQLLVDLYAAKRAENA